MEFSKYIVPIYSNREFLGTGFIINRLLITAYHVIKSEKNLFFLFESRKHKIDKENYVVIEDDDKEGWTSSTIIGDLFVFKTEIEGSDLSLSPIRNIKEKCYYYGFSFDDNTNQLKKERVSVDGIMLDIAFVSKMGKAQVTDNCMTCTMALKPGNSGGPLFQNGMIIGMLVVYHSVCLKSVDFTVMSQS